jgi:hypothetical protein
MNLANDSYFLLENELKKVNSIIERLELEQDINKANKYSYQNYLFDKNVDELLSFSNYSKKKSKSKKTKSAFGHSTVKLNYNNKIIEKVLDKNKKIIKNGKKNKKIGKRGKIRKNLNENKFFINNNNNLINEANSNLEDITYTEIDRKIGPKEPIYCFCNYVSYGNMIKCDNPKCKREWFHFHCVGLRNLPKGKWFCSEKCANQYKNLNKK